MMMKSATAALAFLLAALIPSAPARAQQAAQPGVGVISGGAADVQVEGSAAARAGDPAAAGGQVVGGSDNVFINGKPAARAGDTTDCGGIVVGGSSSVFVNGKPLAGSGSTTTGCK